MSKLKKIAIIGASGLGKEVWSLLNVINDVTPTWDIIGFYDDSFGTGGHVYQGTNCLGVVSDLLAVEESVCVAFAISNRKIVSEIVTQLKANKHIDFPNLIHPTTTLYPGCTLGIGNVIAINTILSSDVAIGDFNFFNGLISVGHDAIIGNYNSMMPRVQISGNVFIGDFNSFGMSAAVLQGKKIGDNNEIFSFTFLTKSIKDNRKYFGIPGRRIKL